MIYFIFDVLLRIIYLSKDNLYITYQQKEYLFIILYFIIYILLIIYILNILSVWISNDKFSIGDKEIKHRIGCTSSSFIQHDKMLQTKTLTQELKLHW